MDCRKWDCDLDPDRQLHDLVQETREIGVLVTEFGEGGGGKGVNWRLLEDWVRSRAVTVADVSGVIAAPGLEVALCSDLVYLRSDSVLQLSVSAAPPNSGVLWALARCGRRALARGLLDRADVTATEALSIGLAEAILDPGHPLPLPSRASMHALISARDLVRSSATGGAGLALELATFRLLFAAGDPAEGARAFLEKREPEFER